MLSAIRKRSAGIMVKTLLFLLILSFAAWGIQGYIGTPGTVAVAEVGGVAVTPQSFNAEYQREMRRIQRLLGTTIDAEQARSMGLTDQVLDHIVNRLLVDLAAADLGVIISDDLVRRKIRDTNSFRNLMGQFDSNQFQEVLRNSGMTEQGYVAILRGELARGQLVGSLQGGTAPTPLVEALYRHRQETRTAEYVRIKDSAMTGIATPTEDDLNTFHKENSDRFTASEYRKLTFISLTVADLAREISIPEDAIAKAFEERRDEFAEPERRALEQIIAPKEDDIRRAHKMLAEGRDFATVATEVAGMTPETTSLGTLGRDQLLPELAESAFSLAEGAYGEPVMSPLGWHVIRVVRILPAHEKTLDEVREALRTDLANEQAVEGLFALSNQLEDELGGGASLEQAATALNVATTTVNAVDSSGLDTTGAAVTGLPPGREFLETAFATDGATESPLVETGGGGYFIVRVDTITPAAVKPLDMVRGEVTEAWASARREEAAEQAANRLVGKLEKGADLVALAGEMNLDIAVSEPLTRSSTGGAANLPPALIVGLFESKTGGATQARDADGYVVARLKDIREARPRADKDGVEALTKELSRAIRGDLLAQLTGAMRGRFPVTVDRQAINRVF